MSAVLIFLGAYTALTVVLTVAVRPYRVRLMTLAHELCDQRLPLEVRDLAYRISIYAYSMRVAPMHVLFLATMLIKPSWQVRREALQYAEAHPALVAETRFDELYDLYMISTAAVNPAFGSLAYLLRVVFRMKARAYARKLHAKAEPVYAYEQLKAATEQLRAVTVG